MSLQTIGKLDYSKAERKFFKSICCPVCYKALDHPMMMPSCKHSLCSTCLVNKLAEAQAELMIPSRLLGVPVACPRCGLSSTLFPGSVVHNDHLEKVVETLKLSKTEIDSFYNDDHADGDGEPIVTPRFSYDYLKQIDEQPTKMATVNSSVVKLIVADNKDPPVVICICFNGMVLGMPACSAAGRISWRGRIYSDFWADGLESGCGVFHADWDKVLDCMYVVLMPPYGDRGIFWAKFGEIVINGWKSGTKLLPLLDLESSKDNACRPRIFSGINVNAERRLLYACHADSRDISVWLIEPELTARNRTVPHGYFIGLVETCQVPGLSHSLSSEDGFKCLYCAVFSPRLSSESSSSLTYIAISNTWDNSVRMVVTKVDSIAKPGEFIEKAFTGFVVARDSQTARSFDVVIRRPRDMIFDNFGNLFVTDHDSMKIHAFRVEQRSENVFASEKMWTSSLLPSAPVSVGVLNEDLDKNKPAIAYAGLVNQDVVCFHSKTFDDDSTMNSFLK